MHRFCFIYWKIGNHHRRRLVCIPVTFLFGFEIKCCPIFCRRRFVLLFQWANNGSSRFGSQFKLLLFARYCTLSK